MYYLETEIEGVTPMKQNKVTDRVLVEIGGMDEQSAYGGKKQTPEEIAKEWEQKAYRQNGHYLIPRTHLQGALNIGMCSPVAIKSNRVKMSRAKAKGTIFVQKDGIITYPKDKKKYKPERNVDFFNTMRGDLICQVRPMFKEGWTAIFKIFIAQDWLTVDAFKEGLIQTGQCHGVGSNRPAFGRFIVKSVKKID